MQSENKSQSPIRARHFRRRAAREEPYNSFEQGKFVRFASLPGQPVFRAVDIFQAFADCLPDERPTRASLFTKLPICKDLPPEHKDYVFAELDHTITDICVRVDDSKEDDFVYTLKPRYSDLRISSRDKEEFVINCKAAHLCDLNPMPAQQPEEKREIVQEDPELQNLRREKKELQQEAVRYRDEIEKLHKVKADLEIQLQLAHADKDKFQSLWRENEKERETQQALYQGVVSDRDGWRRIVEREDEQKRVLAQSINDLQKKMDQALIDVEQAIKQRDAREAELQQKISMLEAMEKEMKKSSPRRDEQLKVLQGKLNQAEEALKTQIAYTTRTVDKKNKQIAQMEEAKKVSDDKIAELQRDVDEGEREFTILAEKLEETEQLLEDVKRDKEDIQRERDTIMEELEELKEEHGTFEDRVGLRLFQRNERNKMRHVKVGQVGICLPHVDERKRQCPFWLCMVTEINPRGFHGVWYETNQFGLCEQTRKRKKTLYQTGLLHPDVLLGVCEAAPVSEADDQELFGRVVHQMEALHIPIPERS